MNNGPIATLQVAPPKYNPWLELRNAIVTRAADDWKECYRTRKNKHMMCEVERFFCGAWCQSLLDMDNMSIPGPELLERIRENCYQEIVGEQEEMPLKVTLIQQTQDPVKTIAKIASICYDSKIINQAALVKKLYLDGHHSVFEHIWFTFKIEGISRACSHQLVRHRLAAVTQRSQRYVEENGFSYVTPFEVKLTDETEYIYEKTLKEINEAYCELIHRHDVPKEDARFLLPNACTTEMYFSCNLRELIHIANERLCSRAQWEIREVVKEMVKLVDGSIRWMLVPKCESGFAICNSPCRGKGYKVKEVENE